MSGAQKFQHVPSEIQAIQFTGDNATDVIEAFGEEGVFLRPDLLCLSNIDGEVFAVFPDEWIMPDDKPATFRTLSDEDFKANYISIEVAAPRSNLNVSWPRVAPEGVPITKKELKAAWSEFMTPLQEAGRGSEPTVKTLLAVLRHMYGAMPEDKE